MLKKETPFIHGASKGNCQVMTYSAKQQYHEFFGENTGECVQMDRSNILSKNAI